MGGFIKTCRRCCALFDGQRCKACTRANSRRWRENNRERLIAKSAKWRRANPEKVKASRKQYCADNLEKRKSAARKYRLGIVGREKHRDYEKKWRAEHPEIACIRNRNRKARKLKNSGKLSDGVMAKLFLLQKGKCPCCGKSLGSNYHLDHILPLARGGTNTDDNVQLLRATCNMNKSIKHPVDFMQSRGFLL